MYLDGDFRLIMKSRQAAIHDSISISIRFYVQVHAACPVYSLYYTIYSLSVYYTDRSPEIVVSTIGILELFWMKRKKKSS